MNDFDWWLFSDLYNMLQVFLIEFTCFHMLHYRFIKYWILMMWWLTRERVVIKIVHWIIESCDEIIRVEWAFERVIKVEWDSDLCRSLLMQKMRFIYNCIINVNDNISNWEYRKLCIKNHDEKDDKYEKLNKYENDIISLRNDNVLNDDNNIIDVTSNCEMRWNQRDIFDLTSNIKMRNESIVFS
jgi:hypothetical protein